MIQQKHRIEKEDAAEVDDFEAEIQKLQNRLKEQENLYNQI